MLKTSRLKAVKSVLTLCLFMLLPVTSHANDAQTKMKYTLFCSGCHTAAIKSKELAKIVNWMLRTFSGDQLPDDFKEFDEKEVERLRQYVLRSELGDTRKALVARIQEYKKNN